jgi:SAM-dependent methyltransferase
MPDSTYIHGTAPDEQARLARLNRLTNAPFLDFLALEGHEAVLEIGSGLGILAAEAAARIPRGSVIGLEHSPDQLAKAPKSPANLSFLRGDAHALPFPDATFDLVYCRYLLEHVVDPVKVLREARRVLRFGGRMLAQENDITLMRLDPPTPAFYRVWNAFAKLQAALGGDATIGRKLFRLFRDAGFDGDLTLSPCPDVYWQGHPNFRPWLDNIIGNIRSGEAALLSRGLLTAAEIQAAIDDIRMVADHPQGSTWFYWNRAAARK